MTMRISANRIDLDDKLLVKPVLKDYGETVVTANTSSSYTINLQNGNVFHLTLTANCSFTFSNPPASGTTGSFTLLLRQDSTGSRTATWPSAVAWSGNSAPTLQTVPDSVDVFTFFTNDAGTTWYGTHAGTLTGEEFAYSSFSSTSGLTLVSCSTSGNEIYLTTTATDDVGNVYRTNTQQYNRSFNVAWRMECSGGSGADGFCIQWTVTNNSTGSAGAGVSRIASSNTIHQILFKTYTGGTPGIDWYENNVQQGSTETAAISLRQDVYYWADYNHTASTLNLYYGTSSTKPGSASHTFTSFSFDTTGYYMGFGAATGGATDNHRLKNWTVTFY